ncbi:cytochrome c oxidase subunit II [Sphingomonas guangdongensis]
MTGFLSILAAAVLALTGAPALAATAAAANTAEPVPMANTTSDPAIAPKPTPADPILTATGAARAPVEHVGQPTDGWYGVQTQVTKTGEEARSFHDNILVPLITVVSLFVLALLAYTVIRFRAKANPVPSKTSHNTLVEVIWTLAPVAILVAIAVPSIRLLAAQFAPPPKGAVTLKATGNQWYWSYEYPDHGGVTLTANMLKEQSEVQPGQRYRTPADGPRLLAADNRVVLPVGVPIRLISTAADVIHSWAMPAFWIKLDAVPGRLNETSFTIEKPGVYFGQCSELCGARHAYMPIAVEAVSPAQFAAWIRAKGGTMPGAAAQTGTTPPAGLPQMSPATVPAAKTDAPFQPAPDNATTPVAVNGTAPANERQTGNTGTLSQPSGQ